jgi:hypothetical protein
MAINPIKILDEVLQGVSLTVNVSAIVDNGGGSYTLTVDNTYYLNRLSKITIDAVEYTVTDFTINTELVVSGDSLPTATSFTINQPLFLYGNPQMVSAEIVKRQDNNTLTYPYIWAVEISTTSKNLNPSAAVKATKSFNLFFFDTVDRENWVIEDHYNQDIYPLSNYIDYFFTILKSRRDLFDSDSITWNETNHVNFGDYIQDQGNREKILNDNITGIQVQAEVPFMAQGCGFTSVTKNCLPVSVTFNGLSVTPTTSGGVKNVVVVNDAVTPIQVGSVTLDNENNLNIEVPAAGGDPVSTSMNGTGLTDTPVGETKAFTIRYADDSPVTVTTITDTANSFEGTVPKAQLRFYRPILSQKTSYNTHDEGWHYINGTFDQTINSTDKIQKLDPDNFEKIFFDDSEITGITSHKYRWYNPVTMGYWDGDNGNGGVGIYYASDGTVSDRATEFTSGGIIYAVDRLSGMGYAGSVDAGAQNLTDTLATITGSSLGGYNDWYLPPIGYYEQIILYQIPNYLSGHVLGWNTANGYKSCSEYTTVGFTWLIVRNDQRRVNGGYSNTSYTGRYMRKHF